MASNLHLGQVGTTWGYSSRIRSGGYKVRAHVYYFLAFSPLYMFTKEYPQGCGNRQNSSVPMSVLGISTMQRKN